ncbi:MAG: restriction endonuclease subunit S [Candidatus Ornithospirochaeta sp.]
MARDMKDSGIEWIGKIPNNWSTVVFGYVADIFGRIGFRGYTADDLVAEGEGPITLSPSNIIDQKLSLKKCSYITWDKYYESPEIQINPGDIILVKTASVGKCAIYSSSKLATLNPQLVVLKNIKCNSKYLYYSLISDIGQIPIILDNFGSVIPTITQEKLSHYKFLLPSILEQQRIASFLDSKCAEIDKALEATKASIEEYKKLRQNIITEAVTKGLNSNVMMKESNTGYIGFIPSNWELKKLRYIGSCQNGISKGAEFFGDEGFPFVNYSDVYKNTYLPIPSGKIRSTKEEQIIYSVEEGDIFFTRTSETIEEIGFSSVCLKTIPEATFAGFLIRVRPTSNELDVRYSAYYFRSDVHRRYFTKEMNLVTRASLGQTLLKNIPVLIPPMEEQQRIADYLDRKCSEIDTLIKSKEKLIEELTAYRKSLIYEYVTGKKEVPAI